MASFEVAMAQLKEQLREGREISELFDYRQSPFPARIYRVLEGTIDLHVHTIPDAYPRLLDDVEAVAQAKAVKMRAVVLKCHVAATPDRAFIAQRAVGGGIDVFGIICLNTPVGGIAAEPVKMALRMGARGVWMPSHWSKHDVQYNREYNRKYKSLLGGETIGTEIYEQTETILAEDGRIKPEVLKILELVAEHEVMLSTGHLSLEEAHLLIDEAKKYGITKLLVHTVNWHVMHYPFADQKKMVEKGAYLEYGFTSLPNPIWDCADPARRISLDDVCQSIRAVGPEHCVLSTDSGQVTSAPPIECLRQWIEMMRVKGFSDKEIDLMTKTNPAKLLGLQ